MADAEYGLPTGWEKTVSPPKRKKPTGGGMLDLVTSSMMQMGSTPLGSSPDATAQLPAAQRKVKGQVQADGTYTAAGGGWAGTEAPIKRLTELSGLTVSSGKRAKMNTTSGNMSDHYQGNATAYAHDLSFGSSMPTPKGDEAASRIVSALGGPANWGKRGGVFNTTVNGIRYQVLYRTQVGGNHNNHIHVGARKV